MTNDYYTPRHPLPHETRWNRCLVQQLNVRSLTRYFIKITTGRGKGLTIKYICSVVLGGTLITASSGGCYLYPKRVQTSVICARSPSTRRKRGGLQSLQAITPHQANETCGMLATLARYCSTYYGSRVATTG